MLAVSEPAAIVKSDEDVRYWHKRVLAAYFRIMGATQAEAAEAVGRAARTIRTWESEDSWPLAQEAARDLFADEVTDAGRRAVMRSVSAGNADLGFKILERADHRFAPATQRVDLGGSLELNVNSPREKLAERLEAIAARRAEAQRMNGGRPPEGEIVQENGKRLPSGNGKP